jgi:hypothetical protein
MTSLITAMLLMAAPHAEQGEDPTQTRRIQDISAFTVPKGVWRIGLSNLDYGISERTSVGTRPLYWLIGPNIKAKATILEGQRLALSVGAGRLSVANVWLTAITGSEDPSLSMALTPLDARLSWTLGPHWSLHFGSTLLFGELSGELSGDQISALLSTALGSEVDFSEVLGTDTLYLGATGRFRLDQGNFAAEWRRSDRNSFIFESNSYVFASALIVGTASAETGDADVGAGAAASFESTLDSFPSATSIAWQHHWDRANLRVGIPLTFSNPLSYTQAFTVYWLL